MAQSGIYYITNLANNKCYVGSSYDLAFRKKIHFYLLRKGKHSNTHLQYAFNKYGEINFTFDVVEEVPRDQLIEVENQYLTLAKALPFFYYNICYYADSAMRGKKFSKEHRQKLSESQKGKKHSEESKLKMRLVKTGKKCSDETRNKMSMAQSGCKHPNYGKKRDIKIVEKSAEAKKDPKIYNFINTVTSEKFTGRRSDFIKTYNLHNGHVMDLVHGKANKHRNWVLVPNGL